MKRLIICFASLLTFGAACEEGMVQEKDFIFEGLVDQQEWSATSASATYIPWENSFHLVGSEMASKYYQEDAIRLSFSPEAIGDAGSVQAFQAEFAHIVGGDAISNSFAASSAEAGNSLTVTRLDTVNKIIEGNFNLRLKRNPHWTKEEEFMTVNQGKFKLKYNRAPSSAAP